MVAGSRNILNRTPCCCVKFCTYDASGFFFFWNCLANGETYWIGEVCWDGIFLRTCWVRGEVYTKEEELCSKGIEVIKLRRTWNIERVQWMAWFLWSTIKTNSARQGCLRRLPMLKPEGLFPEDMWRSAVICEHIERNYHMHSSFHFCYLQWWCKPVRCVPDGF